MLVTLLATVFVLGVLVFIHEFGHFIMAKLVGIRVERFSLGFPPRMVGKKIGETDYCISWIPIGGYVKLSGMIDETTFDKDAIKGEPYEFMSKPLHQRFLVIFAGPLMNIFLALIIFSIIVYFSGISEMINPTIGKVVPNSYEANVGLQTGDLLIAIDGQEVHTWDEVVKKIENKSQVLVNWKRDDEIISKTINASFIDNIEKTSPPIVGGLIDNYPAKSVGIKEGDRIIKIDGQDIKTWTELTEKIYSLPGEEIIIEWQRAGEIFSGKITPIKDEMDGKGKIGIIAQSIHKKHTGILYSISSGFNLSINLTKGVYNSLKLVILGEVPFKKAFGGPIRIAKMAGESARSGAETLFFFMALLSLNLGYINLLPIPVLDGGHIVFIIIEAIIRRPVSSKTKLVVQQIGMALLLALMVLVIINDLRSP